METPRIDIHRHDARMKQQNGLLEESPLQPKECFRRQKLCEASNKFCHGCGSILDKEEMDRLIQDDLERKKTDEYMNAIIQIQGVKEFIGEKVRQWQGHDSIWARIKKLFIYMCP